MAIPNYLCSALFPPSKNTLLCKTKLPRFSGRVWAYSHTVVCPRDYSDCRQSFHHLSVMIFIFSFSHTHQYNTGSRNNGSNKLRDFEKRRNNLSFRRRRKKKKTENQAFETNFREWKMKIFVKWKMSWLDIEPPAPSVSFYSDIFIIDIFPFLFFLLSFYNSDKIPHHPSSHFKQLDRRTGKPSRENKNKKAYLRNSHSIRKKFSSSSNQAASETNELTEYHSSFSKKRIHF